MEVMIQKAEQGDRDVLSELIRHAFRSVADRFSLTKENCPKHPSNCTEGWITADFERGVEYFVLYENNTAAGCVGLEIPDPDTAYIERLAVIPEKRGRHFGIKLVEYVLKKAQTSGVKRVSIGIIAEQDELKSWYQQFGFTETEIKHFHHLPFDVCLMEMKPDGL